MMLKTISTVPRLVTSVTSVTQAENAASFAAEPMADMMQSMMTNTVTARPTGSATCPLPKSANAAVVAPQRMYPQQTNERRRPTRPDHAALKNVASAAAMALADTVALVAQPAAAFLFQKQQRSGKQEIARRRKELHRPERDPRRSHAARRESDAEKALRRFAEAAPGEKAPDAPEALRERRTGDKAVHPAQKGERALPAVEIRSAETAHNAAVNDKALRAERAERIGAKFAPMRKHEKELRPGKAGSENEQNQGVDGLHVKLPLLGAPPDEQQRRGDADADAEPVAVHCETADRKKVIVHGYSSSGMRYAPHPLMRSSKHAPSP